MMPLLLAAAAVLLPCSYRAAGDREIVPVERSREEILALPDQFRGAPRRYNPSQP
jgi:hypothetical protein